MHVHQFLPGLATCLILKGIWNKTMRLEILAGGEGEEGIPPDPPSWYTLRTIANGSVLCTFIFQPIYHECPIRSLTHFQPFFQECPIRSPTHLLTSLSPYRNKAVFKRCNCDSRCNHCQTAQL